MQEIIATLDKSKIYNECVALNLQLLVTTIENNKGQHVPFSS